MTRLELIQRLKKTYGLKKSEATAVIETFFGEIASTLANGRRVDIRGFFTMYVKNYQAYTGLNPSTVEKGAVAAKKLPFFKCGTDLK